MRGIIIIILIALGLMSIGLYATYTSPKPTASSTPMPSSTPEPSISPSPESPSTSATPRSTTTSRTASPTPKPTNTSNSSNNSTDINITSNGTNVTIVTRNGQRYAQLNGKEVQLDANGCYDYDDGSTKIHSCVNSN